MKDTQQCSGKLQNPMDVDELNSEPKEFPELHYFNIDITPERVHMSNNGHSVVVRMNFEMGREPRMRGGPLERNSSYQFEEMQFQWGANGTFGSGHEFPVELHLIFRSIDFKDYKTALGYDNGIAVMGFYFKISEMDHTYLEEFMQKLSTISRKGMPADLAKPVSLRKILPWNLLNYYSYTGSLTMPPCAEKVIWIDFWDPISISQRQLNQFRELTANEDHLKNNYPTTRRINDRIIYANSPAMPEFMKGTQTNPATSAPNRSSCNVSKGLVHFLVSFVINALLTR
ncbi:carbonic anhydrase 1-like [Drosophila sulfurigaster albostrigata]|uniref:carbonic anhydrase 1-like n=1 Tax=Drosophila sulfurigaster albostrigata TaxID=89887 RepID=UPI002D21B167|nr:carbonic anhydrase 1-like [Drosophila sulfurigaster albostrigata]